MSMLELGSILFGDVHQLSDLLPATMDCTRYANLCNIYNVIIKYYFCMYVKNYNYV